ncbi:Endonuclease/exonuclease/phosphatase, partial [Zychaea mexicana]|uniref:Endonuclease/exonuclease/phosphatase n=1 Tax=Zychaea mexicana TaxID=64656 RepID=UPI0022FE5E6E
TFEPYGRILDVGINRDPKTKAYMGNGFAVLDIQPRSDTPNRPLDHHVPWRNDPDDLIYANFDQMPLYCSRCHEPNHSADDCPRSRRNQKKRCQHCASPSHQSSICPSIRNDPQWTPGQSNRSRRKMGHKQTEASAELLKSAHAPSKTEKNPKPTTNNSNRYAALEGLDATASSLTTGQGTSLTTPAAVSAKPEQTNNVPSFKLSSLMDMDTAADMQAYADLESFMDQRVIYYLSDDLRWRHPNPLIKQPVFNMILTKNDISILSINARGLLQKNKNTKNNKSQLIRYLREQQPHIITLQETHAHDDDVQERLHQQFCATQSFWTKDCGIVSLCPDIQLTRINILDDSRHILVRVEHKQNSFAPFYTITIYAPSSSHTARRRFFATLYNSPIFNNQHPYRQRLVLTGDFNYSYRRADYRPNAPTDWHTLLQEEFTNCLNPSADEVPYPTFRRGDSTMSTIDYIFASPVFTNTVKAREVSYVASSWTDHALLSTTLHLGPSSTGKGCWRGNPLILGYKDFRKQLARRIT